MTNFQRKGSISNAHVGRDFENHVKQYFLKELKITLNDKFPLEIGIHDAKKEHAFDFGFDGDNPIVIECKAHTWTKSDRVPSAKLTVWNEAMYYFSLVPAKYRKIFCIQKDFSQTRSITLGQYYLKQYAHLVPPSVEIWEFDLGKTDPDIIRKAF